MSIPFHLVLPRFAYRAMLANARAEEPNECCGLLAGHVADNAGWVVSHHPLPSLSPSPRTYEVDSRALLQLSKELRERDLDWLAIYHSHPTSEPIPSRTDHEKWFLGETVLCVIVSLLGPTPSLRAWQILPDEHREVTWEIVDDGVE